MLTLVQFFDRIPVKPWKRDKINHIRKVGRQIEADWICVVELKINLLMIRAEHILKELICT